MTDTRAMAEALGADDVDDLAKRIHRYLTGDHYDEEWDDIQRFEKLVRSLGEASNDERRTRTAAFIRPWNCEALTIEPHSVPSHEGDWKFARIVFSQGIPYEAVDDEPDAPGVDGLWWPSLAPISQEDVAGLMHALRYPGLGGDALATLIDYAAFGASRDAARDVMAACFGACPKDNDPHHPFVFVSFLSPWTTNLRMLDLATVGLQQDAPLSDVVDQLEFLFEGEAIPKLRLASAFLRQRGYDSVSETELPWSGPPAESATIAEFLQLVWDDADSIINTVWRLLVALPPEELAVVVDALSWDEALEDRERKRYRKGRLVVDAKLRKRGWRYEVTCCEDETAAIKKMK